MIIKKKFDFKEPEDSLPPLILKKKLLNTFVETPDSSSEGEEEIQEEDSKLSLTESSEESEYEEEEENPEWDEEFLKILPMIQNKDPSLFDKSKSFFKEKEEDQNKEKNQENKSKFLKSNEEKESYKDLPLVKQRQQDKKDFLKAVETDDDDLFSVKQRSNEDIEKEEQEFLAFKRKEDKKKKEKLLSNDEILRKFWEAKELDENEKFLRNYLLNKEYVQHDHQKKLMRKLIGKMMIF